MQDAATDDTDAARAVSFANVSGISHRSAVGILAGIIFLGLAVRVGWSLRQGSDDAAINRLPDQREYLACGQHLLSGEGLWFSDPRFEQSVYAYRAPGYPLLIALCGAKPVIVRLAQSVLDASGILAIYLLARRWVGENMSLLAAGLVAVNPYLIFFCGLLLSETLFGVMMIWGMTLLVLSDGPWPVNTNQRWAWLGGGLLLALAILVRPGAVFFPVVLGAGAALVNRGIPRPYPTRWPLPVMAVMLLLTLLVLFPWAARNRLRVGAWIWTTTNAGITRYDGFNPDVTGASDQRFTAAMPWLSGMTEVGRSRYFANLADQWMSDHPTEALKLAVTKIGRTWSPVPLSYDYGSSGVYYGVGLGFGIGMDALILIGLWRGRLPRPVKRYLLLPAIYFTVATACSVGSLRYLVPAQAPMALLAAATWQSVRRESGGSDKHGIFAGQSGSAV